MKKIISFWNSKLSNTEKQISDYERIKDEEILTDDMKTFISNKLANLKEYKRNLMQTIEILKKEC